jgi:hypothetical protein
VSLSVDLTLTLLLILFITRITKTTIERVWMNEGDGPTSARAARLLGSRSAGPTFILQGSVGAYSKFARCSLAGESERSAAPSSS